MRPNPAATLEQDIGGGSHSRALRVGFLNTHPIQYYAPFYRHINRSVDIVAVPIYLTDASLRGAIDAQFGQIVVWDVDLLSDTNPIFVPGYRDRVISGRFLRDWVPSVWSTVRKSRLDALVVHGYSSGASLIAAYAARSAGIPVFLRGDSQLGVSRSLWQRTIKSFLLPIILRLFDGALSIGTRNRRYYEYYGIVPSRIFHVPMAVDNDRFIAAASSNRARIRSEMGVRDDVPLLVSSGKLTAQKRTIDLIQAVGCLRAEGLDCDLLLIGSGSEEAFLREASAAIVGAPVHFAGFVNQKRLPAMLGACDIFVMSANNEAWGLAINEAMCASLPIVASTGIGGVDDLVVEGVNGYRYPPGNVGALVDALRPLLSNADQRRSMGRESRQKIDTWSYRTGLDGLRAALAAVGSAARSHERPQSA